MGTGTGEVQVNAWCEWLRGLREGCGYSLRSLSVALVRASAGREWECGLSASHLGRLERGESLLGEVDVGEMGLLLGVLGVEVGSLEWDGFWLGGCGCLPPDVEAGMVGEGMRWVEAYRASRRDE